MAERTADETAAIARFADALPVAIWVGRAPGGETLYVNREFEVILGLTPPDDAARGNYVGPYGVHGRDGEKYPEGDMPFERVLRSKQREVIDDLVIHRHDGTRCYLRVLASPLLDDNGEVAFVVEAFTDISSEVLAEQRRKDSEQQVQAMQRLESVGSLAGGVAHDFNNLLAVVKLTAQQLRVGESDADRLELLAALDEVSDKAAGLTRALLGFARQGKHLAMPVSLGTIVMGVVGLARRTFERRLIVDVDAAASPDVIVGDLPQLEQIVMNLVMNARDAIVGDGLITVRTSRVHCEATDVLAAGDYVVLDVEDSGGGIDPTVRDRVFEPYVSTKAAGSLKGTGLGLATVYGAARAHGGLATVVRSSGRGTVMRVFFPASALPLTTEPAPSMPPSLVTGKGTILVVDDEPLVLRMTARAVKSLGYEVITAPDGQAAVAALKQAGRGRIDGVILDMIMSGMSGRETYLALRAVQPEVRVVLMTGYALNNEAQEILDLGVQGFLSKPFDPLALSLALRRIVP